MAPILGGLSELPCAFAKLKFESVGSPAPWSTSSLNPTATLPPTHRILLAALVSLSLALSESHEQSDILSAALERAELSLEKQKRLVGEAKREVLESSRRAQEAHRECRRVEGLGGVFRRGAERVVARLDEEVVKQLRAGKGKSVEVKVDDPFSFVAELVASLGVDPADVLSPADAEEGGEGEGEEMDDEWAAIEEDLVASMAARAREKKSPRMPSSFRLPTAGGEGGKPPSLPPTPPASVHSSEFDLDEEEEEEEETDDSSSEQALAALLQPIVHPVLLYLYRLSTLLSQHLSTSLSSFESLVSRSALAVETHRLAVQRAQKTAVKLRDLRELEVREREEEGRVMEELRTTVVELARVALGRDQEEEEEEEEEEDEEEEEKEDAAVDESGDG